MRCVFLPVTIVIHGRISCERCRAEGRTIVIRTDKQVIPEMTVGKIIDRRFRYKRVVIRQYPRRPDRVFESGAWHIVADVPEKVHRAAKGWLCAQRSVISVKPSVFEYADVMRTT